MAELNNGRKTVGTGLPGPGRPPGSPNRATAEAREAFAALVEANQPRLQEWLDRVAESSPKAALELYLRLAEFVLPKVQRVGSAEAATDPLQVTIVRWGEPTD